MFARTSQERGQRTVREKSRRYELGRRRLFTRSEGIFCPSTDPEPDNQDRHTGPDERSEGENEEADEEAFHRLF
jgi:hypothetical protein